MQYDSSREPECIHCERGFSTDDPAYRASCNHLFHMRCKIKYLKEFTCGVNRWRCCDQAIEKIELCTDLPSSPDNGSHPTRVFFLDIGNRGYYIYTSMEDLLNALPALLYIHESPSDLSEHECAISANTSGSLVGEFEGFLLDLRVIVQMTARIAEKVRSSLPPDRASKNALRDKLWEELMPTVRKLLTDRLRLVQASASQ